MKQNLVIAAVFFCFVAIQSCIELEDVKTQVSVPNLPEQAYNYTTISDGTLEGRNSFGIADFVENSEEAVRLRQQGHLVVTDEGATLGRVLFYDKHLSLNNTVSCGTCHKQANAFADNNQFSTGFGGKQTPRNSMAILNIAENNNLFWDSRLSDLKTLALEPVQNHIEMGIESKQDLVGKLSQLDYYPDLFEKTYGSPQITADRISDAMAQFMVSMLSLESRFDLERNSNTQFNQLELMGKALFDSERLQCKSCHAGRNLAAPDSPGGEYGAPEIAGTANIGLDLVYADEGKRDGQFRIPSLRNVALTAPYMHDGRFKTLSEVIDHYDRGVQAHPNVDDKFLDDRGVPKRIGLTSLEKEALIAFLHTLTDESLIRDPKFSDPFR